MQDKEASTAVSKDSHLPGTKTLSELEETPEKAPEGTLEPPWWWHFDSPVSLHSQSGQAESDCLVEESYSMYDLAYEPEVRSNGQPDLDPETVPAAAEEAQGFLSQP